jgi:hypothetical protein
MFLNFPVTQTYDTILLLVASKPRKGFVFFHSCFIYPFSTVGTNLKCTFNLNGNCVFDRPLSVLQIADLQLL